MKLIDIVSDNTAKFAFLSDNSMWYHINVDDKTYQFEIPLDETKGGEFKNEDNAIFFMR